MCDDGDVDNKDGVESLSPTVLATIIGGEGGVGGRFGGSGDSGCEAAALSSTTPYKEKNSKRFQE